METGEKIRFTFPNNPEYVFMIQGFVREIAKSLGFPTNSLNQIDIAIEEAVSNVVVHTHDDENPTFDVICEKISGGIKIILKEHGIPFDPEKVNKFKLTDDPNDLRMSGLGIYLINKVMDGLWFQNLGIHGKETLMVKYLPGADNRDELVKNQETIPVETLPIAEKIEYDVRGMMDHEAIEVSRCAYKAHGYSFFDDHIYYPERLIEMVRTHQMISSVAVTKDNVFMGHSALLFQHPNDKIAELTFAFVTIEYRGQGALNRMVDYLFNAPKNRELTGVYAYAVTNHLFTQKSMIRFGIMDCGVLLATSPNSWKFKGISDDTSQRISVVLAYKYMITPEKKNLFVPEHHREMIQKLYKNVGAPHTLISDQVPSLKTAQPESKIYTSLNELESCAEILFEEYGQDAAIQLKRLVRRYNISQVAALDLFLRLDDPMVCTLVPEFEKLGFFFAGILPESRAGDVLIMQYLNNVDFDYKKVHLLSDISRELLDYIEKCDPNIIH